MIILGVDPGVSGALALFSTVDQRVTCHDMPDTLAGLHDLVASLPVVQFAVVEKPYYPKIIGTKNVARIAEAYGKILSSLAWRDIPVREVKPAEWKAALNVPAHKSASRDRAGQFFPSDADQWSRAKDDGRAEAAMIAWYGLRWAK